MREGDDETREDEGRHAERKQRLKRAGSLQPRPVSCISAFLPAGGLSLGKSLERENQLVFLGRVPAMIPGRFRPRSWGILDQVTV